MFGAILEKKNMFCAIFVLFVIWRLYYNSLSLIKNTDIVKLIGMEKIFFLWSIDENFY